MDGAVCKVKSDRLVMCTRDSSTVGKKAFIKYEDLICWPVPPRHLPSEELQFWLSLLCGGKMPNDGCPWEVGGSGTWSRNYYLHNLWV